MFTASEFEILIHLWENWKKNLGIVMPAFFPDYFEIFEVKCVRISLQIWTASNYGTQWEKLVRKKVREHFFLFFHFAWHVEAAHKCQGFQAGVSIPFECSNVPRLLRFGTNYRGLRFTIWPDVYAEQDNVGFFVTHVKDLKLRFVFMLELIGVTGRWIYSSVKILFEKIFICSVQEI